MDRIQKHGAASSFVGSIGLYRNIKTLVRHLHFLLCSFRFACVAFFARRPQCDLYEIVKTVLRGGSHLGISNRTRL
jgi:hypothetical protein